MKRTLHLVILSLLVFVYAANAQEKAFILDRVVAVVGDFHILQSDIEKQYLQVKMSQSYIPENIKCDILDYFINQKLMMNQAKIDSIEVSDGMVELEMERRLEFYISQFGTQQEMEEYFGKTIYDIKDDVRKTMREMMMTGQVQQSIITDIKITPSEVKDFYKSIPKDSIPFIDSEVKIAQILAYPPVDEDAEFEVKERLLDLRKRIMDGESMSTLAILYSDDPSATQNFGEIGFRSKSELDPAFAETAWALKEGQVSKIVKSSFGYHIIQSVERRGERLNSRHILLIPDVDAEAKAKALAKLDSLNAAIKNDTITFQQAAYYSSEDEDTRASGGVLVNPTNQAASFKLDELDTKDYYVVRDMKVGELSEPFESADKTGKLCYKMVKLIERTEPHRANLKQDYLLLQNMALNKKQMDVMEEWYTEKKKKTYIKIDKSFDFCSLENQALSDL
ncbi:peptidylprolyl isomerase [Bacteroidota bacterium]